MFSFFVVLFIPLGKAVICHSERSEESRRRTACTNFETTTLNSLNAIGMIKRITYTGQEFNI